MTVPWFQLTEVTQKTKVSGVCARAITIGRKCKYTLKIKKINLIFRTVAIFVMLSCFLAPVNAFSSFTDPLHASAVISATPAIEPMLAISRAGKHLVAVGARGVVIVSNDVGTDWTQAVVPVQSDLVAVQFLNARDGWACGHDGVVLHTSNGGHTWIKQLDGVKARVEFESYYRQRRENGGNSVAANLHEVHLNYDSGPWLPWLGVLFVSQKVGYIAGSFGNIAMTSNGGKTWRPWFSHIDNPKFLNLNAIQLVGGAIYIAGEQGEIYKLDTKNKKFVSRPTGYLGSLFGVTGTKKVLIAFGMQGSIYRSKNRGKTWTKSIDPSKSSIMNGVVLQDGQIILVNLDGELLVSRDSGKVFYVMKHVQSTPLSDLISIGKTRIVLTGLNGVKDVAIK